MPGKLVHFEIPAEDVEKLADFYRNVLGWTIDKYEGDDLEMAYWMIMPEPDNEEITGGGMAERQMPEQRPMNYYEVDSIEAFNQRVRDNGGMVVVEKMLVPKMGWFSVAVDPEGNPLGSWVTDENAA